MPACSELPTFSVRNGAFRVWDKTVPYLNASIRWPIGFRSWEGDAAVGAERFCGESTAIQWREVASNQWW